jgi:hypothetical protein
MTDPSNVRLRARRTFAIGERDQPIFAGGMLVSQFTAAATLYSYC